MYGILCNLTIYDPIKLVFGLTRQTAGRVLCASHTEPAKRLSRPSGNAPLTQKPKGFAPTPYKPLPPKKTEAVSRAKTALLSSSPQRGFPLALPVSPTRRGSAEKGYNAPLWMTFKQVQELGGHVRSIRHTREAGYKLGQ